MIPNWQTTLRNLKQEDEIGNVEALDALFTNNGASIATASRFSLAAASGHLHACRPASW